MGPACGKAVCGNGTIDSCTDCGSGGGPNPGPGDPGGPPFAGMGGAPCSTQTEACDGASLGGQTCAGLGYFGGSLGCASDCTFDAETCERCAPTSASVHACGAPGVDAGLVSGVQRVALAADATSVALAWSRGASAHVALLGEDLAPAGGVVSVPASGAGRLAIARSTQGWIAAVESGTGLLIHLVTGPAASTAAGSVASAVGPIFGARAEGPLLAWIEGNGVRAALLAPDGTLATKPVALSTSVVDSDFGSAVFVGDGFLVASRDNGGVFVARVELDGSAKPSKHPVGTATEYPSLAWDGATVRLTYTDFGATPPGVRHVTLDATGAASGAPQKLADLPQQYNVAPIVPDGAGALVLFGGYTGQTGVGQRLDVQRLSADGSPAGAPLAVVRDPSVTSYRIARRGPDTVVAWTAQKCPSLLGVARLSVP